MTGFHRVGSVWRRALRWPSCRVSPSWCLLLVALGGGAARAQDASTPAGTPPDALDVQKTLREQERRIAELERKLAEARPAEAEKDKSGLVHWNELTVGSSKFKLYGFLRVDAIFDDSRPSNTHTIAFIRSEDPTAPASIGNDENDGDFTIHPRLTRIGLDFDGPVVATLGDMKTTGKLEIDFYNNGLAGQSESRQAIRLRHGYMKLTWGDFFFLGGQTMDVISPIWPAVNPDLVMWGAGNLGDRRPQLRLEYTPAVGDGRLILQGAIGLSGADDNSDLDAAGTFGAGFRDGETSSRPTIQGRLAYRFPLWEKQNFELGVWGHRAWEEPDTRFNGENDFDSHALGLDLTLPLFRDMLWVKGELWEGKNVDDVRGGIFQGINTVTGREISSIGGFAEVGVKPLSWYTISAGYSTDDPQNSDLNAGGRAQNQIWYFSQRASFDPVEFGIDYLYWKTKYIGFDAGDDNRVQAFVSYKF